MRIEKDIAGRPQEISERAFQFVVRIVKLCQKLDTSLGVSRTLANQLLRSGTSIGANLEESKGGQSRADFLSKVSISLKEARVPRSITTTRPDAQQTGPTQYWLRLLVAAEIIPENQLEQLLEESSQITAILTTIVKNTKSK